MGFNSAFKGLNKQVNFGRIGKERVYLRIIKKM